MTILAFSIMEFRLFSSLLQTAIMIARSEKQRDCMENWKRWIERVLVAVVVLFVAIYGGDCVVFLLRGSPKALVSVNRYVDIPLKGNRQEFDYQGTIDQPCARSLFPQAGLTPCWRLRRDTRQGLKI